MNWLLSSLAILAFLCVWFYLWGCLILRREGYAWKGIPPMYDGKEPFEEWARKMERGRKMQEREEMFHE